MRLIDALRYSRSSHIAFVGAGGKTTALFKTAREIVSSYPGGRQAKTVLLTTSTHLGAWQAGRADYHYQVSTLKDLQKLHGDLPEGVILVTGAVSNGLLGRLSPILLDELRSLAEKSDLSLLIEADGAHLHPLKAPAEHEPAIPDFTQHVVVVAGLEGLGKPLKDDWVHRVDLFAALSGLQPGEEITSEALSSVLLSRQGGLKNIPCGARRSVLLNQADSPDKQSQARQICERLIDAYDAGIISSLSPADRNILSNGTQKELQGNIHAVIEPIAGIILAAGGSSRFGKPKQLLPWNGQPILRHAALAAINAGLSPVIVVLGSSAGEVQVAIKDLPMRIVINPEWLEGQSSSIKAGINAISEHLGGAVFLQGDQPQIPPALIKSLVEAHQATLHPIIAPMIDGQRGNPVLFDASTFSKLLELAGEVGGKELFSHYPVNYVNWIDSKLLIDIDTPEDYDQFLKMFPQVEVQR